MQVNKALGKRVTQHCQCLGWPQLGPLYAWFPTHHTVRSPYSGHEVLVLGGHNTSGHLQLQALLCCLGHQCQQCDPSCLWFWLALCGPWSHVWVKSCHTLHTTTTILPWVFFFWISTLWCKWVWFLVDFILRHFVFVLLSLRTLLGIRTLLLSTLITHESLLYFIFLRSMA